MKVYIKIGEKEYEYKVDDTEVCDDSLSSNDQKVMEVGLLETTYKIIKHKGETQQKEQPYPAQRALKRIKELEYITDVRIDEEFETTIDDFPKNRLTITIDYLDVDFVKEARKADKYK